MSCHVNQQPWLHTPFLRGTDAVPYVGHSKISGYRYRVLGVSQPPKEFAVQPLLSDSTSPDRTCTACHAISTGYYARTIVPYMVGDFETMSGSITGISPWARQFPQSHQMPAAHGAGSWAEWDQAYGEAVKRLRHCLKKDDLTNCAPRVPAF